MKATFENSVNVLIKAYLNDTLVHQVCTACAVGNLIADACGYQIEKTPYSGFLPVNSLSYTNGVDAKWNEVFMTALGEQYMNMDRYFGEAKKQIDSTGYTLEELARIEYVFETADGKASAKIKDLLNDQWMFNGLLAVFNVLAEIHNVDLETKEESISQLKEAFSL